MKKTSTSNFLPALEKPSLRWWLSILAFACSFPMFAQNKQIDKANEHYQLNQYAEAASLYEQVLSELDSSKSKRSTTAIKTKLANCYRMNNRMEKAEVLYAEVVQDEKTKSDIYFYYGETLMGTGKYEEAKRWFLEYQKLEPDDPKGPLMAEACGRAPYIQPYFPYIVISEFAYNSPADDNGPVAWADGLVFSSDRKQGFKLLKEKSGWTGRDYLDLYFSKKQADGTYGEPEKFSSKLSEVNKNTGNASFSADGSEVFFTRNDNVTNKQQTYNLQIYNAQSTGEDRWKSVDKLPFCSPNFNFMHPAISPDGQWLFFTTNKSGGHGGTDLWTARRKKGGGWENPENLGPAINTAVNEGFPFMDKNGRLYFCSKGHPGFGGFDIFFTEKDENGHWKAPINLGKPLNSPLDDISIFIAPDQNSGMFTSSRNGGDDDIYLFTVLDSPPSEKIHLEVVEAEMPPEEIPHVVQEEQPKLPALEELVLEEKTTVQEPLLTSPQEPASIQNTDTSEITAPAVLPGFVEDPIALPKEDAIAMAPAIIPQQHEAEAPAAEEKTNMQEPARISRTQPEDNTSTSTQPAEHEAGVESLDGVETTEKSQQAGQPTPSVAIEAIAPVEEQENIAIAREKAVAPIASFKDFNQSLIEGKLRTGDRFRLDGATYDPNIWQLTPRVSTKLDELADYLKRFPTLEVELGFHTEALGVDEENQNLSENRAALALDYLIKEGVAKNRIAVAGYGESMPLNHCGNGVSCDMADHLFNQRIEVKILSVDERQ